MKGGATGQHLGQQESVMNSGNYKIVDVAEANSTRGDCKEMKVERGSVG